jgi:hypothetical protein
MQKSIESMIDHEMLTEVLNGEDDLGAVIRAHIHIESLLNNLIESHFEFPEQLKKLNLEFHQKIIIAQAIGLKPEYATPLSALGTLRNNFAHRLDTKLGKNEIESLYKSFKGDDKQIIQNAYMRTKKAFKKKRPKSVTKLEPREQFTLIIISIQTVLIAAIKELLNEKSA